MKSSPILDIDEPDNFHKFIKYRKGDTRQNLLKINKKLPYYYARYISHGKNLHRIKEDSLDNPEKQAIQKVYSDYKSKAIIEYRSILFKHIPQCPYCGLGETDCLDHYLPQKHFSEYALYKLNLIPSCYKCNSTFKGSEYKDGNMRLFFHPYIDSINDTEVLRASIRWIGDNIQLFFGICSRNNIDPDTSQVLKRHFKHLNLNDRYLQHAAIYLSDMRPRFSEDYGVVGDVNALRAAMEFRYRDSQNEFGINHWKTALLKCIKEDEKFMNGGFVN